MSVPSEAAGPSQTILRGQDTRAKIAELSNFEIASDELLRATTANCPLRFCGAALRNSPQLRPPSADAGTADEGSHADHFHSWSRPVVWIAEFWSHSWHDSALLKVVVLLIENNWSAASVVGTLAAFVSSALFAGSVLPSLTTARGERFSNPWTFAIGMLFFVLTLLFWRPSQPVFLDRLCISQTNEKKKLEGVMGIGAFLKSSRRLLVLLDSTYVSRLWCVFELAAYSKLMEKDPSKTLRFIPLPSGRSFIVCFVQLTVTLTLGIVIEDSRLSVLRMIFLIPPMAVHAHVMRNNHESLAQLRCQLGDFLMDDSKCYCCTVGHVHPDTGARLSCDRDVVTACVDSWFGSAEAFNAFVQHRLFHRFAQQVSPSRLLFELHAFASLPFIWHAMGWTSAKLRQNQLEDALRGVVELALFLVVTIPFWCFFFCKVTKLARRRVSSRIADITVSLGVGIGASGLFIVLTAVEEQIVLRLGLEARLVLSCILVIPTCLVCGGVFRFRLSAAHTHGSMFSKLLSIHAGATADVTLDPEVSVLGNGIDQPEDADDVVDDDDNDDGQPEDAEWEDFSLCI